MFSRPAFKNPTLPAAPPLRFPQKLWKITNECQSGAVCWGPDGKSILLRYSLFREEFMSTKNDFFKTDNISSFVRQLNLYGFRKVYDNTHKHSYRENLDLHEFSNSFFQRNRPDLLDKVTRKSRMLGDRNDLWPENFKSMDFSDESSCDKWESSSTPTVRSDHSYMGIQKNITEPLIFKKINDQIIKIERIGHANDTVSIQTSFASKENITPHGSSASNTSEQSTLLPVKKKRGRKPGSKRANITSKNVDAIRAQKNYYSVVLKNPRKCPGLLYFRDDNDYIYLRNTSRDVMLSSTLPFEESPELLELKEIYYRIYNKRIK